MTETATTLLARMEAAVRGHRQAPYDDDMPTCSCGTADPWPVHVALLVMEALDAHLNGDLAAMTDANADLTAMADAELEVELERCENRLAAVAAEWRARDGVIV